MDIHTVSIVGSTLFDPTSLLIEKLIESKKSKQYLVGGLSVSICLLSVASLESYVMRSRYINKAKKNDLNRLHSSKYIKKIYPDFHLEVEMVEIFIVRDILTHNHLWETLYDNNTGESISEKLSNGDEKYKKNVDIDDKKTKILKLNVDPSKVTYSDAKSVLSVVWKILLFLEKKDRNQCYVSNNTYVDYQGKQILFSDIIKKLK